MEKVQQLNSAKKFITGEYVITQDAFEYNPNDYKKMLDFMKIIT